MRPKLPKDFLIMLENTGTTSVIDILFLYVISVAPGKSFNAEKLKVVVDTVLKQDTPMSIIAPRISELMSFPRMRDLVSTETNTGINKKENTYTVYMTHNTLPTLKDLHEYLRGMENVKREENKAAKECSRSNPFKLAYNTYEELYRNQFVDAFRKYLRSTNFKEVSDLAKFIISLTFLPALTAISVEELSLFINVPSIRSRITEFTNATGNKYIILTNNGYIITQVSPGEWPPVKDLITAVNTYKVELTRTNKALKESAYNGGFAF